MSTAGAMGAEAMEQKLKGERSGIWRDAGHDFSRALSF